MNYDADKIKSLLYPEEIQSELGDYKVSSPVFDRECRVKISGFGGQGVLSLGYILAILGKQRNFNVSWLPSYGPEMRGGTANCSVVFSKSHIGSPEAAENCDMLVCMNQPSVEKFLPILKAGGVLVYDSSTVKLPEGAATTCTACPRPTWRTTSATSARPTRSCSAPSRPSWRTTSWTMRTRRTSTPP